MHVTVILYHYSTPVGHYWDSGDDNTVTCYDDIIDASLTNDSIYFQSLEITYDFVETHTNHNVTLSCTFGTFSYIASARESNIYYHDDCLRCMF